MARRACVLAICVLHACGDGAADVADATSTASSGPASESSSSTTETATTADASSSSATSATSDSSDTGSDPLCPPTDPQPPLRLTTTADPTSTPIRENLTQWNWTRAVAIADDGRIHVAWTQLATISIEYAADLPDPVDVDTLPAGRILTMSSSDCGATFSDEVELVASATGVDSAGIAVVGDSVVAIWRALDADRWVVWSRRSTDGGATWGDPVLISDNPPGIAASPPGISSGDDAVAVVWADGRMHAVPSGVPTAKEIRTTVSTDGGASWSAPREVSTPDGFSSWTPAVAVEGTSVHVGWTDERDDVGECTAGANPCREEEYYRRSLDLGDTWGPELRLTNDPAGQPAESWAPSIAASAGRVHVAYFDRRSGTFEVYLRRLLDGGDSFEDEVLLGPARAPVAAARPVVAARGDDVHMAWFVFQDFPADIFHARLTDGGASWSSPTALTDNAPGAAARLPHIALLPDGHSYVIWYDTRHSDADGVKIELYGWRSD